jgi:hypothetical protein
MSLSIRLNHACLLPALFLAATALAQNAGETFLQKSKFENRAALLISNDKLELTVMAEGGAFARLLRRGDPQKLSPLWDPARAAREEGKEGRFGASLGHFVCVDGFGSPSREERAAGLPGHGEAHVQPWELRLSEKKDGVATLELVARLPLVHEVFTRTIRMVDGESVIYVRSGLESLLAFDRPVCWTEHATIGAPFLQPGVTVVDLPAKRATTRPFPAGARKGRRLASGKEFTWPNAPTADGGHVDLRAAPAQLGYSDIATVLLDSAREHVFVTALNKDKHLVFGYLFRASDYPWLQDWENYTTAVAMARGLEFSTQPFGQSRRLTVDLHSLLGAPTYRWLPAKSKIETRFLMFYTETPEGFRKVDDVKLEGGKLTIVDRAAGEQVVLAASLGL